MYVIPLIWNSVLTEQLYMSMAGHGARMFLADLSDLRLVSYQVRSLRNHRSKFTENIALKINQITHPLFG